MTDAPTTDSPEAAETDRSGPETAYGCLISYSRKQQVLHATKDQWFSVAQALLADGYRMCIDLTAVDYLTYKAARSLPEGVAAERFEVVAIFANYDTRTRVRVRTQVPENDPTIASLYVLYPGSDFMEREVFDMFGLTFEGHPDMSRILMPESWVGHPLRKDYAIGSIPVQFKGSQSESNPS